MSDRPELRTVLRSLPVFAVDLPEFDVEQVPDDPANLFVTWLTAAIDAGVREPHAMTLSTCGENGQPDARVLILKDLDSQGWWFATDSTGAKGRQLTQSPVAALTFYWPDMGRQVRVRGGVVVASRERSAEDFLDRGLGARAVALASQESDPLQHLAECTAAVTAARERLEDDPGLVSPTWALYAVVADQIEFWQADSDRQHVRLQYVRDQVRWTRRLLWP
jgi:pyridoxamine 5'-phosphate oxidase